MSRPLRIQYEHALYYITSWGNGRKPIFRDIKDRKQIFYYLNLLHNKYGIKLYAYGLMDNHYHFLMETPSGNLSEVMRDLNGCYTMYFNKHHNRTGHLFQGRYQAILVDKDSYLTELSRCIHLDSLKEKIIKYPEEYVHSSLSYYLGNIKISLSPAWLDINWLLRKFSANIIKAKKLYKSFIYAGVDEAKNPLNNLYAHSILGKTEFIQNIQKGFLKRKNIFSKLPQSKTLQYSNNLNMISKIVANYYNIEHKVLIKKNRLNLARKIFIYLIRQYTDNPLAKIKSYLGNSITNSGISKIAHRLEGMLKIDKQLMYDVKTIKQQIFAVSRVKI